MSIPAACQAFLDRALPRLAADARLLGVCGGGSLLAGGMDEYSDLDLVIAVERAAYDEVRAARRAIARGLGPLLAAFTGEHVGEPRVLICLYGPPLLHVDLKFVALDDLGDRVEDPVILWARDGRVADAMRGGGAEFPPPDHRWIEDRFWIWVHYAAGKIGRGEWFEAHEMLALMRGRVLGPLALESVGARPMGVRRLEQHAPAWAAKIEATIASYSRADLARALHAAIAIYRELRTIAPLADAEREACAYLDAIEERPEPR